VEVYGFIAIGTEAIVAVGDVSIDRFWLPNSPARYPFDVEGKEGDRIESIYKKRQFVNLYNLPLDTHLVQTS